MVPLKPSDDLPRGSPRADPLAPDTMIPTLRPGAILGGRYRIENLLGRGGMGEVWHAFDLKLRVEVALKVVLPTIRVDSYRIESLRREVRTARDVVSPHVCRVFDLIEIDGQEMISMEYVDGSTIQNMLVTRSPLDLAEARDLATQMLAGLQAIHDCGLVHRDLKPANLMLTRAGRLMVMDFGLAKSLSETQSMGAAGTPAYMAPEQLHGGEIGPHTDLFAAGVILAEMTHPEGVRDPAGRQQLWEALRRNPPSVPPGPWKNAISQAIAADPAERFASASELSRALKNGGRRIGGGEELNPYPGLASFTESEAHFFFGREIDIEAVWRKLQRHSMLALIGPSGVGKSSFLRAGLLPANPDGWSAVFCTPGNSPFPSLGRSLVPQFSGDTEVVQDLFRLDDINRSIRTLHRWRERSDQALIVLDQFEELFTLNPPEVQEHFAEFLGRLAVEVDIHVLVSMRDDFFFLCHQYAPLRPLFSEPSPLAPLQAAELRRALVQPARLCGYEFESDALADEMIADVQGERGALPLLAFASARLWELRDRDQGIIPRRAFEDIGRVGGALAQHAEATLEEIGFDKEDLVREIFRNLVTAQQTRVVRERADLLSVFEDRQHAEEVLNALVNARLLTSFEIEEGKEEAAHHRIEIVHESLLTKWPRLVRWQSQDQDSAQLRDQLRQAAQLWSERSQSDDLLWTGTAYKEFELWHERYPGGLSDTEEGFASAMVARNRRQRRQRQIALATVFAALLVVLGFVWNSREREMRLARMNEAARLQMLAEDALATDNTLALALATASLDRWDDSTARRVALAALWDSPVRFVKSVRDTLWYGGAALSPDGEWLATIDEDGVLLWPRDGGEPRRLEPEEPPLPHRAVTVAFDPEGKYIAVSRIPSSSPLAQAPAVAQKVTLWSLADGQHVRSWDTPAVGVPMAVTPFDDPLRVITHTFVRQYSSIELLQFSIDEDLPKDTGIRGNSRLDWTGQYAFRAEGDSVLMVPVEPGTAWTPIFVGRHETEPQGFALSRDGNVVAAANAEKTILTWIRKNDGRFEPGRRWSIEEGNSASPSGFDHSNGRLFYLAGLGTVTQICALDCAYPGAEPVRFRPVKFGLNAPQISPDDRWAVTPWCFPAYGGGQKVFFYPLSKPRVRTLKPLPEDFQLHSAQFFDGGSRVLVGSRYNSELWLIDLLSDDLEMHRLWSVRGSGSETFEVDDEAQMVLKNCFYPPDNQALLIPLDGSDPIDLGAMQAMVGGLALDDEGRRAAVSGSYPLHRENVPDEAIIRIHHLQTGSVDTLATGGTCGFGGLRFLPGNRLIASSFEGLFLWDLSTGAYEVLSEREHRWNMFLDSESRRLLVDTPDGLTLWDLTNREERILPLQWEMAYFCALSPDGRWVASEGDSGVLWVLDLESGDHHLLPGNTGGLRALSFASDGSSILAMDTEGVVRIWPMPEGASIYELPRGELVEYLRSQTNMRIEADLEAPDGYRIVFDPFPGWETVPD